MSRLLYNTDEYLEPAETSIIERSGKWTGIKTQTDGTGKAAGS